MHTSGRVSAGLGLLRSVPAFTVAYTIVLSLYGRAVDSPLTNVYTGINLGLLVLFSVLHIWA